MLLGLRAVERRHQLQRPQHDPPEGPDEIGWADFFCRLIASTVKGFSGFRSSAC